MARYTNFFMTSAPKEDVHQGLLSALATCDLEVVYQDPVYIVAKEKPGQVSFAQLTTVELLLNPPTIETGGAKIDLVVKVFTKVNQAISDANVPQSVAAS